MLKHVLLLSAIALSSLAHIDLQAHCQMPCGVYHDDLKYDQIDQFVETVYKGISVMNDSNFDTVKDKNEFIRWVCQKEKCCNEAADIISFYFLQQKVKPDEADTVKRLVSAHRLLFLLVAIKQNSDLEFVKQFNAEWEKFKLMFHREGYECEMEKKSFEKLNKLRKIQEAKAREEAGMPPEEHTHEHSHDHTHDHVHPHTHSHPTPETKDTVAK